MNVIAVGQRTAASLDGVLLTSLRARAKWGWVRDFIKASKLKPGTGWIDLTAALASGDEAATLRDLLYGFYNEVVIAGNKYVQLYDLHDDVFAQFGDALDRATPPETPFLQSYPYCLAEADLRSAPTDPSLCEVRPIGENDYALVFCSRRDFMERLQFEGAAARAIAESVPALQGYESIVALKAQSFQAFDVVVIRGSMKRLEVMVDLPLQHGWGLDRSAQVLKLLTATSSHLPAVRQIMQAQTQVNLFRAIDGMYRDPRGGVLQDIRVRTSTGLVDHLRTTLTSDNLRQNRYHTASATAVNNEIDPFDITTRLDLTMPAASVTVRLAASIATLAGPADSRWLHGMELLDCVSQRDAIRAVNRVISFAS